MSERAETFKKIIFITGRIDGCQKLIAELQGRVERDQEKIEILKTEIKLTGTTGG